MSNCDCNPLPTPFCGSIPDPTGVCNSIRMFFGYNATPGAAIPGELDKLYYTPPVTTTSVQRGFEIENFSAKVLYDSRVLPEIITFTLTESELLATSNFDGWLAYCASSVFVSSSTAPVPFGIKCLISLGINMNDFKLSAAKMFASVKNGDGAAFFATLYKDIFDKLVYKDNDTTLCDDIATHIASQKIQVCHEWLKNIADTYYGTQFLVRVSGPQNNGVIPGICIKDENGNSLSIPNNKAFYIEGDGSSQGYYSSDEIADGGFPKQCSNNILGLTKIDWIQNTDGKISSFVKIGKISTTSPKCPNLQDLVLYQKFTHHDGQCAKWSIDLSKLDPKNYYIQTIDSEDYLYVKCEVEPRFYLDSEGTWVNIILSDKVPLKNSDINPIQPVHDWLYVISPDASDIKSIFYKFLDRYFASGSTPMAGARASMSQLNIASILPICLTPEAAVIPFKSNVYRYGPYYHVTNPDEGGGIDLVIEENLAPWNFIKPGDNTFPDYYPYCAMDKFGKELAKLTTKGLQKLEKGRVTVVGLPCHDLAESLNSGYDSSKEVGPTLLTDISVEYGSGGFNTTYNFSTYSPRLGKSEKYLRDAWTQNLERTKYINSYLRSEREKINNIENEKGKKILERVPRGLYSPLTIPKHRESTPNRTIFSGYYLSDKIQDTNINAPINYQGFTTNPPDDIECSASPTSIPIAETLPSTSGIRRYAFSEIDKGYSIEHIQKNYFQLAGMSLDGFYLPVSLRGVNSAPNIQELDTNNNWNNAWTNQARLPRFAMRCVDNNGFVVFKEWNMDDIVDLTFVDNAGYPIRSKTRDEIPPFQFNNNYTQDCYSLPINQKYLNPYLSISLLNDPDGPWDSRKNNSEKGFVISSIVFGQNYINYQISHTNEDDITSLPFLDSNIKTDEFIRQKYKNFRIPSLRGPLVLQGWGYDTTGKPIPNAADSYINAEYGQFKRNGLTDKFQKDWLSNPKAWPVGPIDLRFDRERGVWTCPSPNKIIVARLKEDLCPHGSAKAQLLNPEADGIRFYEQYHISGPDGENIKLSMDRTEISVYDFLGEKIKKCSKIYVYFDDNRYIVLRSEPPETIVRFRHIKLCNSGEETPEEYYGADTWGAYAGYGDKYYNYHTYGIRIDCDGNPVDIDGNPPDLEVEFNLTFIKNNAENWLIKLKDNAGKFGPSYGIFINKNQWINEATTGYASLITNKIECDSTPTPSSSPCILGVEPECVLDNDTENKLSKYDILFIESYARFVECELTQDLYVTEEEAAIKYSEDQYKVAHPAGNASANLLEWYGDSPNGREPKFFKEFGIETDFRVFDPFQDAPEDKNPFIKLKYGDRVLAVFNETVKKYMIWQSLRREEKVIKFALTSDKQVSDIAALAVVVDQWGRPLDNKDELIQNQEDFAGNFITVRDPYHSRSSFAPFPNNGTLGPNLTSFGPALGSNVLIHHYNGIPLASLASGLYQEYMPPFLGFALKRFLKNEEDEEIVVHEMFALENYAKYIKGKICSKKPDANNKYFATLAPSDGYKEGIKPICRGIINLPRGNLIIQHPIDQFNGTYSAIGGDLKDGINPNNSTYNNVDGCEFIALLDSEKSTTTNLIYTIVESERFALEGKITLKHQDVADDLNNNEFNLVKDNAQMESKWFQGFMWDQTDSKTNFEAIDVFNRDESINKGLFIKNSVITVYLSGFDANGNPEYTIDNGGTIARVVQRYISNTNPGLFGLPEGLGGAPEADRKIDGGDDFMHGLDPSTIDDDVDKPIIDMSDDQQWMTYEQGILTGVWDETLDANGKVSECKYKIIYAQEAPIIITGTAYNTFTPEQNLGIQVVATYPSCQGADRQPIPILLNSVRNPMGHGARIGDLVTIQRVWSGVANQNANYYYIVIGTGYPPGDPPP